MIRSHSSARVLPSACSTSTRPGAAIRAAPPIISTFAFLSRNAVPRASSSTVSCLRAIIRARSIETPSTRMPWSANSWRASA
jgi:hypothetical protein